MGSELPVSIILFRKNLIQSLHSSLKCYDGLMEAALTSRINAIVLLALCSLLTLAACSKSSEKKASDSAASKTTESTTEKPRKPAAESERPQEPAAVPAAAANSAKAEAPQRVVRPTLPVPQYDQQRLMDLGIRRYESKHLVLYTDIDPDLARPLPKLMDQAYAAWEEYFGPLPPDSAGTDFQMIGHIMSDRALFREAGILTDDIRIYLEGVFRKQVFWMNDQPIDYNRHHLMVHEGTHCYTFAFPNPTNRHIWYSEGMADLFRSHVSDAAGITRFRVFPTDSKSFPGLGPNPVIEERRQKKGPRRIDDVTGFSANDFSGYDTYAWAWSLCAFLDGHSKYRDRFRNIGQLVVGRGDATLELHEVYKSDWNELAEEWLVFAGNVCYGYDIERTILDLRPGKPLASASDKIDIDIAANRGWQSSGVMVEQGKTYRITAAGKCVLATVPKPWESEPQGISIRYHAGQPLGELVATIRSPTLSETSPYTTMLQVIPIGRDAELTPHCSGTLYFRVNDFWNELSDNTESYAVTLTTDQAPP
jgi:hypothetical protein